MKIKPENINTIANILSKNSDNNGLISFSDLYSVISQHLGIIETEIQHFIKILEEKGIITSVSSNMVIGDINFKVKTIQEIRKLKIKEIFDDE
jgi:hypothetical protein